jgi:hypothetical protein
MKAMSYRFVILALAMLTCLTVAGAQQRSLADWQTFHDTLRKRILDNGVRYPRGALKASCDPYVEALGVAAKDRADALTAAQVAQASQDPAVKALFDTFMDLVDLAQDNGNTALHVADIILRVEDNFGPIGCATLCLRANLYAKCIYDEARRLNFDSMITREQVRLMMDKSLQDLDEGYSLRCDKVPGDPKYCGWMYPDLERNPNPHADAMLKEANMIREVSPYFGLGSYRDRADKLMNQYLKDALCLLKDKSHQQYIDLAKQYGLTEAQRYIEGFYATVRGKVTVDDGTGEKPALRATVMIVDPKDGKTWTTTTDEEGRYEIKKAPLHTHVGTENFTRCPKFEISAEYEGARAEDTYEGPLASPDPGYVFEKDLRINHLAYEASVDLDFTSPFVPDRRMSIAALSMHVVFDKVVFEEGPDVDPFGGGVDVDAGDGVGTFIKFELNDVWGDDDTRHRPTFIRPPPKTFEAQLTMAIDEAQLKSLASDKTKKPPAPTTVKLVLRTWTGDITWGSELGSSADGDFSLEFEAPWADLIAGKPVTLKVPYEGESNLDEKGTWTITFAPKSAKK